MLEAFDEFSEVLPALQLQGIAFTATLEILTTP
jgi:hypothetical protein